MHFILEFFIQIRVCVKNIRKRKINGTNEILGYKRVTLESGAENLNYTNVNISPSFTQFLLDLDCCRQPKWTCSKLT